MGRMLPLIHCGYGLGQDAIARDTCHATGRGLQFAIYQQIGVFSSGWRSDRTLRAQSSGLANEVQRAPQIRNSKRAGVGIYLWSGAISLGDEGAISPLA